MDKNPINGASIYHHHVTVKAADIDALKHVNNEVYLRWLLEAATDHSSALGFTFDAFVKMGKAFVVRKHELEYLLPAFLGEELIVDTWCESFEGARSIRRYQIRRPKDDRIILIGSTLWAFVDLKTGWPLNIPAELGQCFLQNQPGESI